MIDRARVETDSPTSDPPEVLTLFHHFSRLGYSARQSILS
ncbi:protein of unknown function [Nitrospira japonica]|uniref:Uncharacterized protein n=1 Tax=Nitrospira japonica TaxID=1325564 RepID=A0A1W1I1Z0_9BACT|nr:protein of unknown function [Nitrospira japonica]